VKYMTLAFVLSLSLSALATPRPHVPHLDPQMSSAEYRHYLKNLPSLSFKNLTVEPEIKRMMKLGERLSKWIELINKNRSADQAIRLTSAATRTSNPIHKPSIYNPEIIDKKTDEILSNMPESMKAVLTSSAALPTEATEADETFIKHARLLDRNYQSASRWKSLVPYLESYKWAAASDVRGYYYLNQEGITAESLKDVSAIPADKVEAIKEALFRMCRNTEGTKETKCDSVVEEAFTNNIVSLLFEQTYPSAKTNWDSFFNIPSDAVRRDVLWANDVMTVPFNTPSIAKFQPYLQLNIEDEFRFGTWGLKLQFGEFRDGPVLLFQPGVVPHVNGLGGNEIVMDSNQPIEEYESQWTIRHEFGHVIGLPDCYHEFYDTKLDAFVNYQLDTTDLMCSRAGNMKERIFDELKRVYAK
jgi:hypothetical protein